MSQPPESPFTRPSSPENHQRPAEDPWYGSTDQGAYGSAQPDGYSFPRPGEYGSAQSGGHGYTQPGGHSSAQADEHGFAQPGGYGSASAGYGPTREWQPPALTPTREWQRPDADPPAAPAGFGPQGQPPAQRAPFGDEPTRHQPTLADGRPPYGTPPQHSAQSPYGAPGATQGGQSAHTGFGGQAAHTGQPLYGEQATHGGQPPYSEHAGQSPYGAQTAHTGQSPFGGTQAPHSPYGQPDQPFPGGPTFQPAGPPHPAEAAKSRMPLLLGAVLAVLLLGGGAGIWALTSGDDGKPTGTALPTTAPSTTPATDGTESPSDGTEPGDDEPSPDATEPSPEETEPPAVKVSVTAPKKLGGRPRLDNKQVKTATGKARKDALRQIDGATDAVAAIYSRSYGEDMLILVAVEADMLDPVGELESQFDSAKLSGMKVTGVVDVPVGSLGGSAKCGRGRQSGADLVLCGWADAGSFGLMIFGDETSVSKVKKEFAKLRPQVEKRG